MKTEDYGPAVVLVYGDGRLEAALLHPCDGGEAYMGPLLRKAVQYAKTHYDSGNMLDVLMSEGEMQELDRRDGGLAETCKAKGVRHIYYVSYRWNADACRKTYHVAARHPRNGVAGDSDIPEFLDRSGVPKGAARLV